MQSKPDDLNTAEKRSRYNVTIVGCGTQGIFAACQFAEAGFTVVCFDSDQTKVNMISKGKSPFTDFEKTRKLKEFKKTGKISATNDLQMAISKADIIANTIQVKMDGKKKTEYSNVRNVFKQIGSHIRRGTIVVVLSAMGIGATETEIRDTLTNSSGFKTGTDFGLAYSPMLSAPKAGSEMHVDGVEFVAAFEKNSLSTASIVLENVFNKRLQQIEQVKAAEAAALFQMARRNVRLALTNELAILCERMELDYNEIAKFLSAIDVQNPIVSTFPDSRLTLETRLLLENAENASAKLRISTLAEEINHDSAKHVINLVKDALANCGKTLKRAKISLLGATERSDTREVSKEIIKLAQMLGARGAKIRLYDPYLAEDNLDDQQVNYKQRLEEALDGSDCLIIAMNHDQFKKLNLKKIKLLMKMPAAIVDLVSATEAEKVEKEGFTYRGLGRGVSRK
jgi:nucleotide sugar dehydrogenase